MLAEVTEVRGERLLQCQALIAAIKAKAKERKAQAPGKPRGAKKASHVPNSAQETVKARDELARIAGVSHNTLAKIQTLVEHADEKTKRELREGKVSINQAHKEAVRKTRKQERAKARKEPPPLDDTAGRFQVIYADPPWRPWRTF